MYRNNIKPKIDFIGIGAAKAGTTWLTECMNEHPQIYIPRTKELNYFSQKYNKKLLGYSHYFKRQKDNVLCGEFSPQYLDHETVPALIYKHYPNTKILVVLRDPIERLMSDFHYWKYILNRFTGNFETYINEHPECVNRGLYGKLLQRYFDVFPSKNIYIIFHQDIRKNAQYELEKVFHFLGVDTKIKIPSVFRHIHTRDEYRVPFSYLHSAVHKLSFLKLRSYIISKIPSVKYKKDTVSDMVRSELHSFYNTDINLLEKLILKDLSEWKKNI